MTKSIFLKLQAELWEIQIIGYWILSFLLLHFSTSAVAHFFGWVALVWALICIGGTIQKLAEAKLIEEADKQKP